MWKGGCKRDPSPFSGLGPYVWVTDEGSKKDLRTERIMRCSDLATITRNPGSSA